MKPQENRKEWSGSKEYLSGECNCLSMEWFIAILTRPPDCYKGWVKRPRDCKWGGSVLGKISTEW